MSAAAETPSWLCKRYDSKGWFSWALLRTLSDCTRHLQYPVNYRITSTISEEIPTTSFSRCITWLHGLYSRAAKNHPQYTTKSHPDARLFLTTTSKFSARNWHFPCAGKQALSQMKATHVQQNQRSAIVGAISLESQAMKVCN